MWNTGLMQILISVVTLFSAVRSASKRPCMARVVSFNQRHLAGASIVFHVSPSIRQTKSTYRFYVAFRIISDFCICSIKQTKIFHRLICVGHRDSTVCIVCCLLFDHWRLRFSSDADNVRLTNVCIIIIIIIIIFFF